MNKKDLKSGYLVETKDGCLFLYVETILGNFLMFNHCITPFDLREYDNDLIYLDRNHSCLDIQKIIKPNSSLLYDSSNEFSCLKNYMSYSLPEKEGSIFETLFDRG